MTGPVWHLADGLDAEVLEGVPGPDEDRHLHRCTPLEAAGLLDLGDDFPRVSPVDVGRRQTFTAGGRVVLVVDTSQVQGERDEELIARFVADVERRKGCR